MEVALVWWLMAQTLSGDLAVAIVPVPYTNEEMCSKAAEHVPRAYCIPQPVNDVLRFGYAHNGFNYYNEVMEGEEE